jgi:hypothetical protein
LPPYLVSQLDFQTPKLSIPIIPDSYTPPIPTGAELDVVIGISWHKWFLFTNSIENQC